MWSIMAIVAFISFLTGLVVGWLLTQEAIESRELRELSEDEMDEPSQR